MRERQQPDPEKVRALQKALEEYSGQEPLIDETREKALSRIRERALLLLDSRARSRQELWDRLVKAEFEPELVDEVLDSFQRNGLVDDLAFAREWVRQRFERRGKSAAMLDVELQRKGVGEADRMEALSVIEDEDERQVARGLAVKKARQVKTVPVDRQQRDKELRRIVGVLARRGFNSGMSLEIAREALAERCAELEED
ncbi:recombination regulator RecX [Corynebacterium tuscaniense]|uniref:Regulatory protein RecX n=1 Tax=Corynebacterium tuscaniense TaxID=302449 RepID=A0A2N6T4B1_9CORY|nr:regulatory protein RecX [Corynebacterium tuscaniense]KAA8740982.1 regulatory protein RecX [Corynebacterium tuscaniense]KGF25095.1 recombinase RecX [Corynebacterium tuscaniense DNF00037]PMC64155.1 recombination regulator RecX [Corynebacterium tuscaniense]